MWMAIGNIFKWLDIRMVRYAVGNIQMGHRAQNHFGFFVWTFPNSGMWIIMI